MRSAIVRNWIPAFAGTTYFATYVDWIPACAGMKTRELEALVFSFNQGYRKESDCHYQHCKLNQAFDSHRNSPKSSRGETVAKAGDRTNPGGRMRFMTENQESTDLASRASYCT